MQIEIREPVSVYGKTEFSVAEYLKWEKTSEIKHEFLRGEIFSLAGASRKHNKPGKDHPVKILDLPHY